MPALPPLLLPPGAPARPGSAAQRICHQQQRAERAAGVAIRPSLRYRSGYTTTDCSARSPFLFGWPPPPPPPALLRDATARSPPAAARRSAPSPSEIAAESRPHHADSRPRAPPSPLPPPKEPSRALSRAAALCFPPFPPPAPATFPPPGIAAAAAAPAAPAPVPPPGAAAAGPPEAAADWIWTVKDRHAAGLPSLSVAVNVPSYWPCADAARTRGGQTGRAQGGPSAVRHAARAESRAELRCTAFSCSGRRAAGGGGAEGPGGCGAPT